MSLFIFSANCNVWLTRLKKSEMALIVIVVTSLAPIRHNHYQVFLGFHQLSVIFFLAGVWAHLRIDSLPQMPYVNATITLWSLERAHRIWTIYLKNIIMSRKGLTINNAEVEICPAGEEAVRVSVAMPKGWKYEPGTHVCVFTLFSLFPCRECKTNFGGGFGRLTCTSRDCHGHNLTRFRSLGLASRIRTRAHYRRRQRPLPAPRRPTPKRTTGCHWPTGNYKRPRRLQRSTS